MEFIITVLLAILGALIFTKLKVPAGALIGSLFLVALYNVSFNLAYFPSQFKLVVQAVAGAYIGQSIQKDDISELKQVILPSIAFFLGLIVICFGCGWAIHIFFDLNLATSLISCTPGGLTDMTIISSELGADSAQSTILQLVRYLMATIIMPVMAYKICKLFCPSETDNNETHTSQPRNININSNNSWENTIITSLIMIGGGTIGFIIGMPAGVLVFSLVAVCTYNIKFGKAFLPRSFRYIAQIMAGAVIASRIGLNDIIGIRNLIGPAIIILIECLMINYILGPLISRFSKLDMPTMIFASIPAGLSDMALISVELGGDAPKVTVMHLVRYVGILAIFPTLISIVSKIFG